MKQHVCGLSGERSSWVPCVACEVVEDNQEKAFGRGQCGQTQAGYVCTMEHGHPGCHQTDKGIVWRKRADETISD